MTDIYISVIPLFMFTTKGRWFILANYYNSCTIPHLLNSPLVVAYCNVPTVAHGRVFMTENCPNRRCIPGSGVVHIICDLEYQLIGYGRLICAGYNKFRTPIPTCKGKTSMVDSNKKALCRAGVKSSWNNWFNTWFLLCNISSWHSE